GSSYLRQGKESMTKQEKLGQKVFSWPPKKPLKRPMRCYVHYESQGGELLAFEVTCSSIAFNAMVSRSKRGDNVVKHFVDTRKKPQARLVVLPSQGAEQ